MDDYYYASYAESQRTNMMLNALLILAVLIVAIILSFKFAKIKPYDRKTGEPPMSGFRAINIICRILMCPSLSFVILSGIHIIQNGTIIAIMLYDLEFAIAILISVLLGFIAIKMRDKVEAEQIKHVIVKTRADSTSNSGQADDKPVNANEDTKTESAHKWRCPDCGSMIDREPCPYCQPQQITVESFCSRIYNARQDAKIKKDDLADALGISLDCITAWENGDAVPNEIAQNAILSTIKELQDK